MFAVTVINFLLSSLTTGNHVAAFIVYIRKALILNIDHPLLEMLDSLDQGLGNINIVSRWTEYLPVSTKLSLSDLVSIMLGTGTFQRCHCRLEGLGPLSRSTVGSPHTVYCLGWNRG